MASAEQANSSLNSTRFFQLRQDCDVFLDSTLVKAIKIFAYSILMILSLGGNSLVIATIYRKPKLRTIVNLLILNLSASDLLMPLFAYTIRMKRIYEPRGLWPVGGVVGSITCKLIPFAENTSIAVSVITMEVIAVERFFSVVYPMKRQPINSKKSCFITIALVWLIGIIYSSLYFYTSKIIHKGTKPYCINSWEPAFVHAEAYKVQFTVALILFTMVPFVLFTSLYSTIIISLHRQNGRIKLSSEQATCRNKKYKRIAYMLITIVAIFFLSWAPVNVYVFLSAFVWPTHRPCESRHVIFSAMFVAYSSPALNPFVYFTFNSEYRKSFQELLGFQKRPKSSASNEVSPEAEEIIPKVIKPGSSKAVVLLSVKPLDVNNGSITV